jgi:hypothetical protein
MLPFWRASLLASSSLRLPSRQWRGPLQCEGVESGRSAVCYVLTCWIGLDVPRCLSRWSFPALSNTCRHREHGHRASEICCASDGFCRGYRRNRESHGIGLCHRACFLSPGFFRAISCGPLSGRGGRLRLRSVGRHVGRHSGRTVCRCVCTSRAADALGCCSFAQGRALAKIACWDAPLCCETCVSDRDRRGGHAWCDLRFCGWVSMPSSPWQVMVLLFVLFWSCSHGATALRRSASPSRSSVLMTCRDGEYFVMYL